MHRSTTEAASIRQLLQRARGLQNSRRIRDMTRCYWIEGIRHFVQACDGGCEFDTIIHNRALLRGDLPQMLVRRCAARGIRRIHVSPEEFRSISITERASGIGAIVKQHWTSLRSADARAGLCWLVLESVRSAGNFGTILRTAEATGVAGVILLTGEPDPFDPAVVRASMGGIFHLRLVRTSYRDFGRWSTDHSVERLGLAPRGEQLWSQPPSRKPVALLIGEERAGLTAQALSMCDSTIRLPMSGRADSLNVAVAAGVMIYELVRRRSICHPSGFERHPR